MRIIGVKTKTCVTSRRRKQTKKSKRNATIVKYCNQLRRNLPQSEKWFWKLWKKEPFNQNDQIKFDKSNFEFCSRYIPDVINCKDKYVIEIDGEYHNNLKQIKKDKKKTEYFESHGYRVFRIKAYDMFSYQIVRDQIKEIRLRTVIGRLKID